MNTDAVAAAPEQLYTMQDRQPMTSHGERPYTKTFHDLPAEEKPRERLLRYGPGVLSSAELIAILMGVGTRKEDVMQLAKRMIKDYGEVAMINERNPKRLATALEIPEVKACQLIAAFELGRRFFKTSVRPATIRTARQAFEYAKDMRELPKEHLRGIYLDAHYRVLHDETISIGSVSANIVHPREVFRPALEYGASAVILVHNHPSGVVKASAADREVTSQLVEAGKIMGIHLLDHVVVGKSKFESIAVEYDI